MPDTLMTDSERAAIRGEHDSDTYRWKVRSQIRERIEEGKTVDLLRDLAHDIEILREHYPEAWEALVNELEDEAIEDQMELVQEALASEQRRTQA